MKRNQVEPSLRVLGWKPTLQDAQKLVGGSVELINLSNGDQMLVNEEGLLQDLEYNHKASRLANRRIVGDAILLKGGVRW